jgi:hypothetical protein
MGDSPGPLGPLPTSLSGGIVCDIYSEELLCDTERISSLEPRKTWMFVIVWR